MAGISLAALSLNIISEGQESDYDKRARAYLRTIQLGRQRIEDFLSGEYGPRKASRRGFSIRVRIRQDRSVAESETKALS
jgi:hypothetical protein